MPDRSDVVLRTENLVKQFSRRTVVRDVSIELAPGEVVGLLGPNGAGKTTTFRMTVGLLRPNRGHIWFRNRDVTLGFPCTAAPAKAWRTFLRSPPCSASSPSGRTSSPFSSTSR